MRLGISKSKNTINYYIIKDYTKNGKRSTKHVLRIGNQEEVEKMAGNMNYKDWLREYVKKYNEEHCNSETIIIKKNNKKIIPMNTKNTFNVGYLFLEKLYNQLNIKSICDSISDKYKYKFDLNEILSYLIFARIIYPSSKLETFKQCQNFINQPKFKLHDEYRALNYIAETWILFKNNYLIIVKMLLIETLVLFIMIVLIISLKLNMKMILKNMVFLNSINLLL